MPPHNSILQQQLDAAPNAPGCYLFYDAMGRVIYVGKSKRLRQRVRSYFTASAKKDERIADLIREIADFSMLRTETELDALIQEYLLIKHHKPWFNAQHIRTITPWFLHIQITESYPTISPQQRMPDDSTKRIGPFKDAFKADAALALLHRVWQTPLCGQAEWPAGGRPCLHYDMRACRAPCCGLIPAEEYQHIIHDLVSFFSGTSQGALGRLEESMHHAATALRFEEASSCKETMEALIRLRSKNQKHFMIRANTVALVFMRGFSEKPFSVFYIQDGVLCARVSCTPNTPGEEALRTFLQAIQAKNTPQPDSPQMIRCLSEISAQKAFVPLTSNGGKAALCGAFLTAYATFAEK